MKVTSTKCIAECRKCITKCQKCCQLNKNKASMKECCKCCKCCIIICNAVCEMLKCDDCCDMTKRLCMLCASCCKKCATQCAKIKDNKVCKDCSVACKTCETTCKKSGNSKTNSITKKVGGNKSEEILVLIKLYNVNNKESYYTQWHRQTNEPQDFIMTEYQQGFNQQNNLHIFINMSFRDIFINICDYLEIEPHKLYCESDESIGSKAYRNKHGRHFISLYDLCQTIDKLSQYGDNSYLFIKDIIPNLSEVGVIKDEPLSFREATSANKVSRYINISEADAKLSNKIYTFNLYIDLDMVIKSRIDKQIRINSNAKRRINNNEKARLNGKVKIRNN
jgi:hypothetical protein